MTSADMQYMAVKQLTPTRSQKPWFFVVELRIAVAGRDVIMPCNVCNADNRQGSVRSTHITQMPIYIFVSYDDDQHLATLNGVCWIS